MATIQKRNSENEMPTNDAGALDLVKSKSRELNPVKAIPNAVTEKPHPELSAEAIGELQAILKANPSAGKVTYSSTSKLVAGLKSDVQLPLGHKLVADEPTIMPGGMNAGPNPLDLFCAALGTCQEITYKAYATAMGIKINTVAATISAPVDLRGFLGVDGAPRCGFMKVEGVITLDAPGATCEQLAMLKAAVDSHCPMCDTTCRKIPLELSLLHVEAAALDVAEPASLTADAIGNVQAAFGAEPALALTTYSSASKLTNGLMSEVTFPATPEHKLVIDEPPMMPGGSNAGPNPCDLVCAALGTCQEITYKAYATAMGLRVNSISAKVEGDVDLAGFLGVNADTPMGFSAVRCIVTVESPEPKEKIELLKRAVDAHCPMCDALCNETPLSITYA